MAAKGRCARWAKGRSKCLKRMKSRKKARKTYRRRGGLGGHVRTCVQYACKPGRGGKAKGHCPKGKVLRCVTYVPLAAVPPKAGQRKGYAQVIYGRYLEPPGGLRSLYTPTRAGRALAPIENLVRRRDYF